MARTRSRARRAANRRVLGNKLERENRDGLSYKYQVRLRKVQRERIKEEQVSKETKERREEKIKQFQLSNIVNQRAPTSIQSIHRGTYVSSISNHRNNGSDLKIEITSTYINNQSRRKYKQELIEERKNTAAQNDESEFRNPLSRPIRGLDEDESDIDYMEGREIRRELRTSHQFEEMFHKYICEREELDWQFAASIEGGEFAEPHKAQVEAGINEMRLVREQGQSDEDYFEKCLAHSFAMFSTIGTPDLLNEKPSDLKNHRVISSFRILVESFKLFYEELVETLDDSILILAFSLQLLNINYFWKDLRSFMRRDHNKGLKKIILIAGIQSQSQLIQEALIELLSDLSFSDFGGQQVNRILYFDCQEVVRRWLSTSRWNCQQTLGNFFELLEDLFWSQAVVNKPRILKEVQGQGLNNDFEKKRIDLKTLKLSGEVESDSEEEEKQMEHGMEDITQIINLKPQKEVKIADIEEPQIYHRKDDFFKAFVSSIFYNLLNIDYRLNVEGLSVYDLLERSWQNSTEENEDQEMNNKQKEGEEMSAENEEKIDLDFMRQLQMENDGISLGSDTTTECSEYSEDLIDEEDIQEMTKNLMNSISFAFTISDSKRITPSAKSEDFVINHSDYIKDNRIYTKNFVSFFYEWIAANHPNHNKSFRQIDILMNKVNGYATSKSLLTQIKFCQFEKLDAKGQIEYLKELDYESLAMSFFKPEDYADDIIIEILKGRMRDAPPYNSRIVEQSCNGLWGRLFYRRPVLRSDMSTEEQYKQPKWVRRAELYEQAVDLIHKILIEGGENLQHLIKYLGVNQSITFSAFLRSILRREIGSPLKTVKLAELKRSDFLPFKIDNGYEVVDVQMKDIEFGEKTYSYKKMTGNSGDFSEKKSFYIYDSKSVFTREDLEVTREGLEQFPDHYRYSQNGADIFGEGGIIEDEQNEEGFEPNRQVFIPEHAEENVKGRKGRGQPEQQKLYKLKKYSILSIKSRGSETLTKIIKYDKLDNRVSIELLRSGAALLLKRISRINDDRNRIHFRLGYSGDKKNALFVRSPLYYMYTFNKFPGNRFIAKFLNFSCHIKLNDQTTRYCDCLYVKRTKKVVYQKNLSDAIIRQGSLAFERISCGGKAINFDDPRQREQYYTRLFKLTQPFHKSNIKLRFTNEEEGSLPASRLHPYYFRLSDYTFRCEKLVKYDFLAKGLSQISSMEPVQILADGERMSQSSVGDFVKKVMPRGENSRFEGLGMEEVLTKTPNTKFDRFGHDVDVYKFLYQRYTLCHGVADDKTGLEMYFHHEGDQRSNYGQNVGAYKDDLYLRSAAVLEEERGGDGKSAYVHVIKQGTKRIFRLVVKPGARIGLSPDYRRMYLVTVSDEGVGLRVVTFDAIAKYVNNRLTNF